MQICTQQSSQSGKELEISLDDITSIEVTAGVFCNADFCFDPSETLQINYRGMQSGTNESVAFSVDSGQEWKNEVDEAIQGLKTTRLGW